MKPTKLNKIETDILYYLKDNKGWCDFCGIWGYTRDKYKKSVIVQTGKALTHLCSLGKIKENCTPKDIEQNFELLLDFGFEKGISHKKYKKHKWKSLT